MDPDLGEGQFVDHQAGLDRHAGDLRRPQPGPPVGLLEGAVQVPESRLVVQGIRRLLGLHATGGEEQAGDEHAQGSIMDSEPMNAALPRYTKGDGHSLQAPYRPYLWRHLC